MLETIEDLERVLGNDEEFRKEITSATDFFEVIKKFPKQIPRLYECLARVENFKCIVKGELDIHKFFDYFKADADLYPNSDFFSNTIFDIVKKDPEAFQTYDVFGDGNTQKIIGDPISLELIVNSYPTLGLKLFELFINSPDEFNELIRNPLDEADPLKNFDQCVEVLCERVVYEGFFKFPKMLWEFFQFPDEKRNALCEYMLHNDYLFEKLIKNLDSFVTVNRYMRENYDDLQYDRKFLKKVIDAQDHFRKLFKKHPKNHLDDTVECGLVKENFPEYKSIFNTKSFKQLEENRMQFLLRWEKCEIRKNARVLFLAYPQHENEPHDQPSAEGSIESGDISQQNDSAQQADENDSAQQADEVDKCYLSMLPPELIENIALFTVNTRVLDKSLAVGIFRRNYKKPTPDDLIDLDLQAVTAVMASATLI